MIETLHSHEATILLALIVIIEGIRLALLFKPTTKKTFFKSRLAGVNQRIFDLEFKKFKMEQIREGVRRTRDDLKMKLEALISDIKSEAIKGGVSEEDFKEALTQPETDKALAKKLLITGIFTVNQIDEFKRLIDQKVLLDRDIKRQEGQLDICDREIYGRKPNAEDREGTPGLVDELDSQVELKEMLADYIRRNV